MNCHKVHACSMNFWAAAMRECLLKTFGFAEDGVIDASDLRAKLGNEANIAELIRQADKNMDGKIDRSEFCEMLKSM
jgi:Ca2+-binding EF-hand superfamily protein